MRVNYVTGPTLAALAMASLATVLCLTFGAGDQAEGKTTVDPASNPVLPAGVVLFGDVDCSGIVNSVDALKVLRHTISLPVSQSEPCDDIGAGSPINGDVDCDNDVDPVDALRILRHGAGLSVIQNEPCPGIGT